MPLIVYPEYDGPKLKQQELIKGGLPNRTRVQKQRHNKEIHDIIKKIKHYKLFFTPIEESVPVSITRGHAKYASNTTRQAGHQNISQYFASQQTQSNLVSKIKDAHDYLLKSIKKLREHGIVHFDLRQNNIIMDSINHVPIITDFDMAFVQGQNIQIPPGFHPGWPLDVYLIAHAQKHPTMPITQDKLDEITNQHNFPHEFKQKVDEFYKAYIGKPWQSLLPEQTTSPFTKDVLFTWDVYALAVLFRFIIEDYAEKNTQTEPQAKLLAEYKQHLNKIIYSLPNER